jgi:hypothetical protein
MPFHHHCISALFHLDFFPQRFTNTTFQLESIPYFFPAGAGGICVVVLAANSSKFRGNRWFFPIHRCKAIVNCCRFGSAGAAATAFPDGFPGTATGASGGFAEAWEVSVAGVAAAGGGAWDSGGFPHPAPSAATAAAINNDDAFTVLLT